jgi:hypothetical protein
MRLSEEKIKDGIVHPAGPHVRTAAADYFAESFSPDPTVMPRVIEAVERYGRERVFGHVFDLEQLAQTEATIGWVVEELSRPFSKAAETWTYFVSELIAKADPQLLLPHGETILASRVFPEETKDVIRLRIDALDWDAERCWRELDAFCEEHQYKTYIVDVPYDRATSLIEQIARQADAPQDRIMAILQQGIGEYEGNPMIWKQPLMARLAGEIRFQEAVPVLLSKLDLDDDVLKGECQRALVKIGTDAVLRGIRNEYRGGDWSLRLALTEPLSHIHSDLAVEVGLELLAVEQAADLRTFLGIGLARQFSTEATEAVRQLVLIDDYDEAVADLSEDLAIAGTLLGPEFPDLGPWREAVEKAAQRREQRRKAWEKQVGAKIARMAAASPNPIQQKLKTRPKFTFDESAVGPQEPVRSEHKVGRNDPCPCGSGKKFKKCCMRKGEE